MLNQNDSYNELAMLKDHFFARVRMCLTGEFGTVPHRLFHYAGMALVLGSTRR